jgi:hypothetical protein
MSGVLYIHNNCVYRDRGNVKKETGERQVTAYGFNCIKYLSYANYSMSGFSNEAQHVTLSRRYGKFAKIMAS